MFQLSLRGTAGLIAALAAGGALAQGAPATVAVASPSARTPVGEVTFAVGPTVRISADGVPEPVRRGTRVLAGDRLDTAEGGLIHVKFIDGALVSLRPGSRLWVEDYRFNPAQVSQSLVRFRLDQGVARAISGAAAEGARERFRLNTPLVAIGVRGTDFVVRSDAEATTAAVNQGAIVMAPFGAGCLAQALGPCNSPSAKLLSADMGQLLVEFRPQFGQPEIKPQYAHALASPKPDVAHPETTLAVASAAPTRPAPASEEDAVSASLVRGLVASSSTLTSTAPPPPAPPPTPDPVVTASPPPPAPPPPPPPPPQLQWGRWAEVAMGPDDISVVRDEARVGRSPTVGDAQYLLYRIENATGVLDPGLGAYEFSLTGAQARYSVAGQADQAATVQGGRLGIDFAAAKFSTSLNVTSAATGQVSIGGSGYVRSDGVFFDRSLPGQAIAGATSLDGKSAGYLFEKAVGAGSLTGITLWSRP